MPNNAQDYPKFSYDEHARTCAPDDLLGQVRRTVQGVPVSDDQVQMIVTAIQSGLRLKPDDVLLELACGNGVLSQAVFDSCKGYLGIDISECLISVAKKNFEALPDHRFAVQGAAEYLREEPYPGIFTKALCYAGFQFFSAEEARQILHAIFTRFKNVRAIFIGNLPDKERAANFYKEKKYSALELADCQTAIGIWRTQGEFEQLAAETGWKVSFSTMPAEFHASYYRYDALLSRA